jgi:hypothetical protein
MLIGVKNHHPKENWVGSEICTAFFLAAHPIDELIKNVVSFIKIKN